MGGSRKKIKKEKKSLAHKLKTRQFKVVGESAATARNRKAMADLMR